MMNIDLHKIKIRDLVKDYVNCDQGVTGYGGKLNIRPKYQREFVYKDKDRDAVINTINCGFPLNVMYWVDSGDDTFEVLDGQQRTVSICEYIECEYSIDGMQFNNLTQAAKDRILDYELYIYWCEGTDEEKLDWFEIINIAGVKLTKQELRNAVYTGPWLTDAKRYFSKPNKGAAEFGKGYLSGEVNRQIWLETCLKWISGGDIKEYMSDHQHHSNANDLWLYFQKVINWVKTIFPNHRKIMESVDWGYLYNNHKKDELDATALEIEIKKLLLDTDVKKKKGVWPYVITRDEKHLSIRTFEESDKIEAYERQNGICPVCQEHFKITEMDADHITKWADGGPTLAYNCRVLCVKDNRSAIKSSDFKIAPDWLAHQRDFLDYIGKRHGDRHFEEIRDAYDYLYPERDPKRVDSKTVSKNELENLISIRNKYFAHGGDAQRGLILKDAIKKMKEIINKTK